MNRSTGIEGERLKGKQKVSMNNRGKIRDRDILSVAMKGRVNKPDHKWRKRKRQNISLTDNYLHVKYESNRVRTSMGTVCKPAYLAKQKARQLINKERRCTLSFGR